MYQICRNLWGCNIILVPELLYVAHIGINVIFLDAQETKEEEELADKSTAAISSVTDKVGGYTGNPSSDTLQFQLSILDLYIIANCIFGFCANDML